ncbi:FYN-binding protein 1 isoform X3 [Ictalurus furcatus]|uniref:FYN-binding protein 1 isoform X3 n=1 Tax=Ictalurus furcatus TaxID=66913 RepID=UPI0023509EB2|nr:FYN-binding protein 1 isoform X3 [Ictalurus furcatus]
MTEMEPVIGLHVSCSSSAVRGSSKQCRFVRRQTASHTHTHTHTHSGAGEIRHQTQQEPTTIMDNKSDVRAIRARFQTAGVSMEGSGAARPKTTVHPTLSGPMVPSKKPALEVSLSGSAAAAAAANSTNPRPSYVKNIVSNNSAPEPWESSKSKALVSRFENANANEDSKPPFAKPLKPKPPDWNQNSEQKPKIPLQKPLITEAKNVFPKPPVTTKPFKSPKPENNESTVNTIPTTPKMPAAPKPKSSINLLWQQAGDEKEEDQTAKPFSRANLKNSSFHTAHNRFNKPEEPAKDESKSQSSKESQVPGPSVPQKKPSYKTKPSGLDAQTVKDPLAPKKNPLTNLLALGSAPSKPNRPPKVNLEKFKKAAEPPSEGPEIKKGGPLPPPPPASHPSTQAAPILPPRPPGPKMETEEEYDDVGDLHDSSFGNSGRGDEGSGSDGETYEELDGWSTPEVKEQEKKREKEEKKRAEQEKKDQKEREKKEQEARKKFKLSGPLQVIHKVKARVDCKGGRNDLSFKQGESIDILRITDNPEGRWLARTQDGSCGYVKTESVQIDFDTLKNQSRPLPENDGDVYDDVGSQEDNSRSNSGPGVVLPPPPEGPDDIYDDLDDSSLNVSPEPRSLPKARSFIRMLTPSDWRKSPVHINVVPPPPQFSPESNPGAEEIYDDVDTPQPPSSLPPSKSKPAKPEAKTDDPKKQKKFEKEEKEFRKKFKFDGEIKVLYQATVIGNKKGSGKDLAVQAGDILDVISNLDNDKLICRNKEGKFGYVLNSNVQSEDNDIYDDVGDDCIYDNDN